MIGIILSAMMINEPFLFKRYGGELAENRGTTGVSVCSRGGPFSKPIMLSREKS